MIWLWVALGIVGFACALLAWCLCAIAGKGDNDEAE